MAGKPGEEAIAYHQGDEGDFYISEILVFLEMFNRERFEGKKHPHNLYSRTKSALEFYQSDLDKQPSPTDLLIPKLPEILELYDMIKQATPAAAKKCGLDYGRVKIGKERAGAQVNKGIPLPFLGNNATMNHQVSDGWVYPMLAAFRANVLWDIQQKKFEWVVPLKKLLPAVIEDLVQVCVTEHNENRLAPDKVGKRESTYVQCFDKIRLYLLENR